MSKLKKRLAMIISMVLLVGAIPVGSFAKELEQPVINEPLEEPLIEPSKEPLIEPLIEPLKEPELKEPELKDIPEEISKPKDIVVYNLGKQEITVGYDINESEETPLIYKLFNEDGSYTIELEDNAFFPYEVQFTADDNITIEWFNTPESTVQIGEHKFNVHSEQNDDTKLSQIGFWIADEYVAAYPNPKTFTNSAIEPFSLLPLGEVDVTLDLTTYGNDRFSLKDVKMSAIISGLTPDQSIDGDKKVVWCSNLYDDDYKIAEQTDTINFSNREDNFLLKLIVGSALQLDDTNIKYNVKVSISQGTILSSIDLYQNLEGVRTQISPKSSYVYIDGYDGERASFHVSKSAITTDKIYMGLSLNEPYNSYGTYVKVYKGSFPTRAAAEAAVAIDPSLNITEKIFKQDMTSLDSGFAIDVNPDGIYYRQTFTFVFCDNDLYYINVTINELNNGIRWYGESGFYIVKGFRETRISDNTSSRRQNGIQTFTYTMKAGYSANDDHALRLGYEHEGDLNASYVTKAVVGHFDTAEAASSADDIKDRLFSKRDSGKGYIAKYSGNGQNFTVFAEGEVYKITVKAIDAPDEIVEINPGSSDTYFRVDGATGLVNTYVLPYEHDTYYDTGFQTVFYTDDVELTSLAPTFWEGENVNVYSGHTGNAGTLQVSGTTVQDFSSGPVQYAVAAENGLNLKNYWVTFVKKQTGAKLFVNGINGEDGAKREVFLTSTHNNIHDIFIANVGDAALTGISATLSDAQNIKLDPYWTVGGAGNDTLAAFTTTKENAVANIGKIRLIPDGEGEVKGTLTISATGQEDVVITLTGNAGDPKLVTGDIPEAVKYVPYAAQITHNNKYNWNTVTLEKISGDLPEGVILKPNGELYGVPKNTGSFTFMVRMSNSYAGFGDYTATYTLVVKENDDININDSVDTGYEIRTRIPSIIKDYQDYIFISEGALDEFVGLWLNGTKLIEITDYTKTNGSTKITINSQTFKNKTDKNGTNTIAAEFRVGGNENNELKKAAQNFKVNVSGGSGSGTSGSNSSIQATEISKTPVTSTPKPLPQEVINTPKAIVIKIELLSILGDKGMTAEAITEAIKNAISEAMSNIDKDKAGVPIIIELIATGLPDDVNSLAISIPMEVIRFISEISNASLRLNMGKLGIITLNNIALKSMAAKDGETAIIAIAKSAEGSDVTVSINIDGVTLTKVDGGIRVELPGLAKGEVIILVKTDGGENIVKKSVVDNGNVYALLDGSGIIKVINNAKTFSDVNATDWFKNAVFFASSRELFVGLTEDEFAQDMPMNRAMLATVLHRLEDKVKAIGGKTFTDVPSDQWFSDGISWVSSVGIMTGYTDELYGTNDNVTREQLAVTMYRYANQIGMNTVERGDIQKFNDAGEVSPWANEAMRWAVGIGLLQGSDSELNPKDTASRGEVAAVIMNFINILVR